MRKLFVFTLFVATMFAACKKEVKTASQLLESTVWKLSEIKENGTAGTIKDCDKDNKVTYSNGGSFAYNFGVNKCTLTEANSTTGNWSVENADKTLKIVTTVLGINQTQSFTIVSIDETKMVLSYEKTAGLGSKIAVEETYVPAQ